MTNVRNPVPGHASPTIAGWRQTAAAAAVLLVAAGVLFATSATSGNFCWSDAPRHALNGAFIKDFIADLPLRHPVQWAYDYYAQYPALTILFYPPLFYVVLAGVYAVLGVSQAAAQLAVCAFGFALAVGAYALAKRFVSPWAALGAALLLVGAPEMAYWGRMVMLDIPAYAFLVAAVLACVRHVDTGRPVFLYAGTFALLAAVYTKFDAGFLAPVLVAYLAYALRWRFLASRHAWINAGLFAVLVLPALFLFYKFGQENVESIVGGARGDLPRASLAAWLFYLKALPVQMGWVTTGLAALFLVGAAVRRDWRRTNATELALLLGWYLWGYLCFSLISVREPRHGLLFTLPAAIFAVLFLERVLPARLGAVAALALGAATLGYTLMFYSSPCSDGSKAAADYVADHAPENAVVLYSGHRDGSFVFALRTREDRRDIATVRSDKLLLKVAIERARGVKEADYTEEEIAKLIDGIGASYVVAQQGYWADVPVMARLQRVLDSPHFEKVKTVAFGPNPEHPNAFLNIYRNRSPVAPHGGRTIDLPTIRRSIEGVPLR